jgi:hypothetical protein
MKCINCRLPAVFQGPNGDYLCEGCGLKVGMTDAQRIPMDAVPEQSYAPNILGLSLDQQKAMGPTPGNFGLRDTEGNILGLSSNQIEAMGLTPEMIRATQAPESRFAMKEAQATHLHKIVEEARKAITEKYTRGAEEHGTILSDQPLLALADFIVDEAVDQLVYALTLRDSLEKLLEGLKGIR